MRRDATASDVRAYLLAYPGESSEGDNARRNPMLLLRLSRLLLLRYATRAFLALLFHEPPRSIGFGHTSRVGTISNLRSQDAIHARASRPISASRSTAYSYCFTVMSDHRSHRRR